MEHTRWLRSLARQLVSDANTADDVVQATLVAALAWGERPREGLRSWLAGVARNVARQIGRGETRRKRRELRGAVSEALPSAGEMVELVETQRRLATAVLGLAEHYRSTIILRFFEELTPTQIAQQLDIPASTVRVRLKRGLEQLRERLEAEYRDDDRHWSLVILPLALPPRGATLGPASSASSEAGAGGIATETGLRTGLGSQTGMGIQVGLTVAVVALALTAGWLALSDEAPAPERGLVQEPAPAVGSDASEVDVARGDPAAPQRASLAPLPDPTTAVAGPAIVGRVLDERGRGVPGARVEAVDARARAPQILELEPEVAPSAEATTDGDGRFRLEVRADQPYVLRASHSEFAPAESRRTFAGESRELALARGGELRFSVTSLAQGAPLTGVQLVFESVHGFGVSPAWSVAATTDEAGEAHVSHVPRGELRALARLDGYASSELRVESPGEGTLEHQLSLREAVSLDGEVLDAATGRPVPGAELVGPAGTAVSDHLGRFRLGGFASPSEEPQSVVVVAEGFAPRAEYVGLEGEGPRPFLRLRLEPPTRVTGRVTDRGGLPVAGADVAFRGRFSSSPRHAERHAGRVVSDELGRFELDLHPVSGYTIGAQARGLPMVSTRIDLTRDGPGQLDLGELVLMEGGVLRGAVQRRDGEESDTVELFQLVEGGIAEHRQLLRVRYPAPDGSFGFDDIAPGSYELRLRGVHGEGRPVVLARRSCRLASGEEVEDLVLRPSPPISGTVRLEDGRAPERVRVGLRKAGASSALASVRARPDGSFQILPPEDGPFLLIARDPALLHDPATLEGVEAGASGIELVLRPRVSDHTVRGRVVDVHGNPVGGVKIQFTNAETRAIVTRVAEPDARGRFSLSNLEDCAYDLRVIDDAGRFEAVTRLGVRPGGDEVEIRLRSLGD